MFQYGYCGSGNCGFGYYGIDIAVLDIVDFWDFGHSGMDIAVLDIVVFGYCGSDIVIRILWYGYCGMDIMVWILWHGYCGLLPSQGPKFQYRTKIGCQTHTWVLDPILDSGHDFGSGIQIRLRGLGPGPI